MPNADRQSSADGDSAKLPDRSSTIIVPHHAGLSLRLRLMLMLLAAFGTLQVTLTVIGLLDVRRTAEALIDQRTAGNAGRGSGPATAPTSVHTPGSSLDPFVRSLWNELSFRAVIATPIGLLVAAVAGWFIAGFAVRPLQRLSQIAARLRPDTLQEPIHIGSRASELTGLQSELDQMRQRLEAGYEAQERFVANVSHEIKTPIATVLTEAQTLPKAVPLQPEVRQFIESTQDEMRRLGRLVESFLLLTRVRHGKPLQSTARAVSINEIVMDSVQHCWKMAEQYEVRLIPELAAEDERDLKLHGDPDLLRTMVDNLIRNAIRFSPKNEAIPVLIKRSADEVCVCVRDRGPGISPELADKIFDRFSQAKSEEKLGRGSGLGLEIAQGIAELHGGRIVVTNLEGSGCEFCATLPLLPAA